MSIKKELLSVKRQRGLNVQKRIYYDDPEKKRHLKISIHKTA